VFTLKRTLAIITSMPTGVGHMKAFTGEGLTHDATRLSTGSAKSGAQLRRQRERVDSDGRRKFSDAARSIDMRVGDDDASRAVS